ncbi:MAG: STAS domain-containing protein [Gammaproteobacteria bacterium]|nr:STAS domain-containing protein [Gammaproteobacteria bacterium]
MQIPILKQGLFLIVSIQTIVSDEDLISLEQELSAKVWQCHSKGVVIDVTTLDVLDSFSTRMLRSMASTVRLLGAETVIVGIQPDVAFAMVQLNLKLDNIQTALNLEDGLIILTQNIRKQ